MDADVRQYKPDRLWKFSENLTDICILGMLCLICSLPVITTGAALTAMYTVFAQHIIHRRRELVRPFFTAFRENLKNATILWLMILPAMVLFAVDAFYYLSGTGMFNRVMGITMFCLLGIVLIVHCYAFTTMAVNKGTVKETLIKSIQCSYMNWPWTLLILVINAGAAVLMFAGLWYFAFLFVGATGYANSHIIIRVTRRHDYTVKDRKSVV